MNLYADSLPNNGVTAKEQMRWQEQLANSAHQREMEDLKAAGLNPWLASNAGSAVPSGSLDSAETLKLIRGISTASGNSAAVSAKAVKDATKYVSSAMTKVAKEFSKSFDPFKTPLSLQAENTAKETAFKKGQATIQDVADLVSLIPVIGSSVAKAVRTPGNVLNRHPEKRRISYYMTPDQEAAYIEGKFNPSAHSARDRIEYRNDRFLDFVKKLFKAFGDQ